MTSILLSLEELKVVCGLMELGYLEVLWNASSVSHVLRESPYANFD